MTKTTPQTKEEKWLALRHWSTSPRMSEVEGLMWRGERHPEFSSAGLLVEILDREPDWARLRAALEWATQTITRLRQVVVDPVLPTGPPAWRVDDTFDLDYHLRRYQLPAPADMPELLKFAQGIGTTPMDHSRPLWSCHVVAMAEGRAAVIFQVHHSMTDGQGVVDLITSMHSDRPEASLGNLRVESAEPAPAPDSLRLSVNDIAEQVRTLPSQLTRVAAGLSRIATSPGRSLEYLNSLRRVMGGPAGTKSSPLLAHCTGRAWRYGVVDCRLDELKAAGKAAGGGLNDAYMAGLLAGVRRYHESLGIDLGDIAMGMPISIRRPDDPPGGNRFAGAVMAGPAGESDPADRIAAIRGAVVSARDESALEFLGVVSPVLNRLPTALLGQLMKLMPRIDISGSNVAGIAHELFAAGAKVERLYGFAPLPNLPLIAEMISYDGTVCVGMNADGAVYEDSQLLWESMREGFDEVLALARR
jgi:diacylglycerol O-acyltransferase / wax synthase